MGEILTVMTDLAGGDMTMMVVTHEVDFARQVADRVVFMADGKVVEEGSPSTVLDDPVSQRAKAFFGRNWTQDAECPQVR